MAPFIGSIIATVAVFIFNSRLYDFSKLYLNLDLVELYRFLSHKWYFDTVYNRIVNQPALEAAYNNVFKLVDKGVLELAGPTGLSAAIYHASTRLVRSQTGRVYDYAWFMLAVLYLYTLLINCI